MWLVRKKVGLRYAMDVVPTDARWVKGSHGRLPVGDEDAPVLLCSDGALRRDRVAATDVKALVLEAAGLPCAPSDG